MSATQVDFLLAGLHDSNGVPLAGGQVYTYFAGTTTKQTAWTDKDKTSAAANPLTLDSNGQYQLYCDGWYKIVVKDAAGTTVNTWDNLNLSSEISNWMLENYALTYVTGTQFTIVGNLTSVFTTGRNIKAEVTAGTIYGTVSSSSYGSPVTTVNCSWFSGALDSGLSAVYVGLSSGYMPTDAYTTLTAALVPGVPLLITNSLNLTANVTTSLPIQVVPGNGKIVQTAAFTLTINGSFQADGPTFSGFSGSSVIWGSTYFKEVKAEWFYSGSGTWDTAIQAANDSIVASALPLTIKLPASCTLDTGVSIDVSYAKLKGDNTYIDASAIAAGGAITLVATTGLNQSITGVEGVNLVGGSVAGTAGILIESAMVQLRDVKVSYFEANIELWDNAYQNDFFNVTSIYADYLLYIPAGGTDYGTEYRFFGCNFYGQKLWHVYAAAGTGGDLDFFGCSFNYADATATDARMFCLDGMRMFCSNCHTEQDAVADLDSAIQLRTTAHDSAFSWKGGHFSIGDDVGTHNFTSIIDAAPVYPYCATVELGPTPINSYCSGGKLITTSGTGRSEIHVQGLDYSQTSMLIPVVADDLNVMTDGGFEEAKVLDNICVYDDSTGITGRLVSSSVSIAVSAAEHHTDSQALEISKSTAASTVGSAWLYVPIRGGERPFFDMWVKSAQTFSIRLRWAASGILGMDAFVVDTVTGGYLDIVNRKYETIVGEAFGGAGWEEVNPQSFTLGGGHYHSLPVAPYWATHFVIEFDLEDVNNGAVYVDDLIVNIVR
jgi:hypothetical protein